MTIASFLIVLGIHLLDPFKVVPLLAICYYAKSRLDAIWKGALLCLVVQGITAQLLGSSRSTLAVPMLIGATAFGALFAAALFGPLSRWRARRDAKTTV